MKVEKDYIITIQYILKDEAGQLGDTSTGEEPLEYLHGHGLMLPGVEKALGGKSKGESVAVWIDPEEGFGKRNEENIIELSRLDFEGNPEIESGMEFDIEDDDGEGIITVLSVDGDTVLVDRNHPLAGKKLYVEAEIIDIKKAEKWEIEGWKHHTH